jgi:hypothetical protein
MKKIIILTLVIFSFLLYSQELEYQVEKPTKMFVGSPFKVNIQIISSKNDSIYSPPIDTLDVFVLQKQQQQDAVISENKKQTEVQLTFQAFDTGEYTFPELEFTVVSQQQKKTLKTSSFQVKINSVLADSSQAIKDIAPPQKLNLTTWDIIIPILLLGFLIFAILNIYKALHKSKKPASQPKETDNRPAFLKALELLRNLKQKEFLKKGEFLLFYFHLSYILRFFLEKQYNFNAVEMTTSEIRRNYSPQQKQAKTQVMNFLQSADRVKFAKHIPTLQQAHTDLKWLEDFLNSFASIPGQEDINV